MRQNRDWQKAVETCLRLRQMTFRAQAGRAGEVQPKHIFQLAVRARALGRGGSKQGHERLAECGGNVHRPGVVGNQQIAKPDPFDHFWQRSCPAQIQATAGRGLHDLFPQRLVAFVAEQGETRGGKALS